jgi:hypothetical protein
MATQDHEESLSEAIWGKKEAPSQPNWWEIGKPPGVHSAGGDVEGTTVEGTVETATHGLEIAETVAEVFEFLGD